MYNELIIMGTPNVGKSTLINELKKDSRYYIPKHVTNRAERSDDAGFYAYKETSYFFSNDMYIKANDDSGIYYGVAKKHLNIRGNQILVLNSSLKKLKEYSKKYKNKFVCIITSRNPVNKIKEATYKYIPTDMEYRIAEMEKELKILDRYCDLSANRIYYIEDFSSISEMVQKVKNDLNNYYFEGN